MASSVRLDIEAIDRATAQLVAIASRINELGDNMRKAAEDAEALAVAAARAKDNIEELGSRARLIQGSVGALGREADNAAIKLAALAHEAENVSERFRAIDVNIRLAQSALRSMTRIVRDTVAEFLALNHEIKQVEERLRALMVNVKLAQSALRSFTRELRDAVKDVAALAAASQVAVASLGELAAAAGVAQGSMGGFGGSVGSTQLYLWGLIAVIALVVGPAVLGALVVVLDVIMGLILALSGGVLGFIAVLGTLALAFQHVGKAIAAGWSGGEEKFQNALDKLTASQKAFVLSFMSLKPVLKDLQDSIADSILPRLGPLLTSFAAIMAGPLKQGLGTIAVGIGAVANGFARWATTTETLSEMTRFLKDVGGLLKTFAPHIDSFLSILLKLANFSIPFWDRVLKAIGGILDDWDAWMSSIEGSATMRAAMETMAQTFELMAPLIEEIGKVLVESLADPATRQAIKDLILTFIQLIKDLGPELPNMVKAFDEFVKALYEFLPALTAIIQGLDWYSQLAFQWIQLLGSIITWLWDNFFVVAFKMWVWLYDVLVGHSIIPDLVNAIIQWFQSLPGKVIGFVQDLVKKGADKFDELKQGVLKKVSELWTQAVSGFQSGVNQVVSVAGTIRNKVLDKLQDLVHDVFKSGYSIVQSIADGINSSRWIIEAAIGGIASLVKGYLPFSPAKYGPLSGSGNPFYSGQSVARLWAEGMLSARASVANAAAVMAGQVPAGAYAGAAGGFGGSVGGSVTVENFYAGTQTPGEIATELDWLMRGRG